MSLQNHNFKNNLNLSRDKSNQLLGLSSFVKNIERHYFTSVSIGHSTNKLNKVSLVIEMHFNFELAYLLHQYQLGNWGDLDNHQGTLLKFVNQLKEENEDISEIDELTLHFENTSIIIDKIYQNSIAEQFDSILKSVSKNFISFTKGLTCEPNEIFIPVFEEELNSEDYANKYNSCYSSLKPKDYFKFWALYYDGERKAAIYDVKSSTITSGNLFILNNE